jgi:hypothetical protein
MQAAPGYQYYVAGNPADVQASPAGGLALMGGGTDIDAAFAWMNGRSGGGDFPVIRASGTDAHNQWIYDMGGVDSVATLVIKTRNGAPATEPNEDPFSPSKSFSLGAAIQVQPVEHEALDLRLVPHSLELAPAPEGFQEIFGDLQADQPARRPGALVEQAECLQEFEHLLRLQRPAPREIIVGEELNGAVPGPGHSNLFSALISS